MHSNIFVCECDSVSTWNYSKERNYRTWEICCIFKSKKIELVHSTTLSRMWRHALTHAHMPFLRIVSNVQINIVAIQWHSIAQISRKRRNTYATSCWNMYGVDGIVMKAAIQLSALTVSNTRTIYTCLYVAGDSELHNYTYTRKLCTHICLSGVSMCLL